MLKHVVAHRSNSSLGGCSTSSNSCLSSFNASGPASLSSLTTGSPPPLSSFTSTSSLPSSRRSSLSSAEVKSRPVYRRTESYQPYSLPTYRESSEIVADVLEVKDNSEERRHPPREESWSLEPKTPSGATVDKPCNEIGYKRVYQNGYYRGYGMRSCWDRSPLNNHQSAEGDQRGSCATFLQSSPESPPETQQSFVEKINLLDSYPSNASNRYDVDDLSNSVDVCELRLSQQMSNEAEQTSQNKTLREETPTFPISTLSTFQPYTCHQPSQGPQSLSSPQKRIDPSSPAKESSPRSTMPPIYPRSSSLSIYPNKQNGEIYPGTTVPNSTPTSDPRSPRCMPYFLPKSNANIDLTNLTSAPTTPLPPLPRSSTLPRRDMKEELRRASLRSNASSISLLSSASCSSLSFFKNLDSRSTSTSSLSDTIPVKIYLRRLRPDMEYKTVSLSSQTTCKELIGSLLTKFRLRHRDPKLFFIIMEVTVQSPADNAPVKRTLVLDDNARPAELQQCRPKGESRFSVGVRRGGLVRVHDSILMPGSQYKSLMVSYNTNADELVQLMLKCYNSMETPQNYAVHEVCKNPYKDRQLVSDECPLMVQYEWPRLNRTNWAFVLRRNLTYAFSLKSRMNWRRSLDQSSTDTESEVDDHNITSSVLSTSSVSSTNESRSSSVSSTSSVSSACSSTSSENSLDSGYLGSPLSGCKVPTNPTSTPLPNKEVPKVIREVQPISSRIRSILPVTATVSRLSLNSSKPSVSASPVPVSSSTPTSAPGLPPRPKTKTIITITSKGRAAHNTSTNAAETGSLNSIQRSHLRPIMAPPSLKVSPCNSHLPQSTDGKEFPASVVSNSGGVALTKTYSSTAVTRPSVAPPPVPTVSPRCLLDSKRLSIAPTPPPSATAEMKLLAAIESLKTLCEVGLEEKHSAAQ